MNAAVSEFGFHEVPPERQDDCATHGEFTARNLFGTMWTKCPACASERSREAAAKRESEEKQAAIARWQARIGSAGIPERFRSRTLETYRAETDGQRAALAFAQDYADDFANIAASGKSALFIGKPGTGKTHLAVGIGLSAMGQGFAVMFTTAMRALRRVKETWSKGSEETEREAIAALVYPHLLILDEVGIQFGSDTEKLILFDVLNERYEKRKPTLLLSNLTLVEVRDYLGERIFDRLREDGGEALVFDWSSHRGIYRKTAAAGGDA